MSCRNQHVDGEAHLLHELELVGENSIGKRENVRGVRWWLFCGHDKLERISKCTERKKCNKNTETDNGGWEQLEEEQHARTVEYEHRTNKSKLRVPINLLDHVGVMTPKPDHRSVPLGSP
jgi:hypothetical protein